MSIEIIEGGGCKEIRFKGKTLFNNLKECREYYKNNIEYSDLHKDFLTSLIAQIIRKRMININIESKYIQPKYTFNKTRFKYLNKTITLNDALYEFKWNKTGYGYNNNLIQITKQLRKYIKIPKHQGLCNCILHCMEKYNYTSNKLIAHHVNVSFSEIVDEFIKSNVVINYLKHDPYIPKDSFNDGKYVYFIFAIEMFCNDLKDEFIKFHNSFKNNIQCICKECHNLIHYGHK